MLLATAAADCLQDFARNLGCTVEVLGFTTTTWKGGRSRQKWLNRGRVPSPGRLCDLLHVIYLDANSHMSGTGSWAFRPMLRPDLPKENIDGEAVEWARDRLKRLTQSRKFLIIISDGAPVDDSTLMENGSDYLLRHLRSVVGEIEAEGEIRLSAIGIGHDVTSYYSDGITAEYLTLSAFGIKVEPLLLVREAPNASMGSWDQNQTYPTSLYRATNVEMTAIFDADQTSRQTWPPKDFAMQSEADRQRRVRTGELLDQGLLHSADDLYHAAFVYQHGDNEADYLKAHVLATAAVARGKAAAKWIAAATLDRYLLAIGRPQVFGTQYMTPKDKATTQEPYDRTAISDALRAAMGVPSLNLQTQTLIQMKNAEPAKKPE